MNDQVEVDEDRSKKLQTLTALLGPNYTHFGKKIYDSTDLDKDCDDIIQLLKAMGPSAIEIELTSLAPEGGGSLELMVKFLQLILSVLRSRKSFEAAQAYLGLFLKLHSDVVMAEFEMIEVIKEIQDEQQRSWNDLKGQLTSSAALVSFYKSSLVA